MQYWKLLNVDNALAIWKLRFHKLQNRGHLEKCRGVALMRHFLCSGGAPLPLTGKLARSELARCEVQVDISCLRPVAGKKSDFRLMKGAICGTSLPEGVSDPNFCPFHESELNLSCNTCPKSTV